VNPVDTEEWARRASSFGAVAAEYAEHRPEYTEEAVRWCVAPLGRDIARLRVLDLGAGTGKLTALLARLGADVTAVEPDEAMLAELHRQLPSVRALHGPAEAIPLPDGSVDVVLCGQSMHWFDLKRAVPEIARVLVGGGVLAALWNSDDDRVPWVAGLRDASEGAAAPTLSVRRGETATFGVNQFGDLFEPITRAEFANSLPRTAQSLVATMATHSQVLVLPPADRERLLGQVRDYLAARPETGAGEFELPMVTTVLRTRSTATRSTATGSRTTGSRTTGSPAAGGRG
jgi:SAM-dependent methyltransferase